jgi:hypothetical protein
MFSVLGRRQVRPPYTGAEMMGSVHRELRLLIFAVVVLLVLLFMPRGLTPWIREKIETRCPRCKQRNPAWREMCRVCGCLLLRRRRAGEMPARTMVIASVILALASSAPPPFEMYLLDDAGEHIAGQAGQFETATDRWMGANGLVEQTRYLETNMLPGETVEQATSRLLPALPAFPPDRRYLLGRSKEKWSIHEAMSRPILETRDVKSATLEQKETLAADDVSALLQLTDQGAEKFAVVSGAATKHRIAIVLDGALESAPVVQGPISGGVVEVRVGSGTDRLPRARALIAHVYRAAGREVPPESVQLPVERQWASVVDPGQFEILMPGKAQVSRRTLPGGVEEATYHSMFGGVAFSLRWGPKQGKHPLTEADDPVVLFLEREWGVRAMREGSLILSGHRGLAIRLPASKNGVAASMRLYEVGARLYNLSVMGLGETSTGAVARKFFESFRIADRSGQR